jgi:hypothetical protein
VKPELSRVTVKAALSIVVLSGSWFEEKIRRSVSP